MITPAEPHLAQSALGTKSRWTWIYLDPFRLLQTVPSEAEFLTTGNLAGPRFRNLIVPRKDPFIGSLTRELVGELQKRPRAYQTSVKALVWSLMVRLQRLAPSRTSILVSSIEPAMRRIAPALDLMAKTYANRSDARRWARCCHLSATHFRRLFRKAMGKSPHAYLTELRVRMTASRLHSTDEKIINISLEAGFPSPSSLNRAFRRVMKTTPREWRALK